MTALATLDTLIFHKDLAGLDATNPFLVEPDGLKGWWGGVSYRHASDDKPVGHGQFDAPAYRGPRIVVVEGWITLPSFDPEAFETAMDKLETVLDDGSKSQFLVHEERGDFAVDVRRHDASDIIQVKYGLTATFQLPLWAPSGTKVAVL